MIWSDVAIDYSKGVDKVWDEDAQAYIAKPRKIGCYVMTIEEARACIEKRFGKDGELDGTGRPRKKDN